MTCAGDILAIRYLLQGRHLIHAMPASVVRASFCNRGFTFMNDAPTNNEIIEYAQNHLRFFIE
ncbi:MAG: hypothetical protein A2487_10595 [Candidatus Raymondbacteria bacterium RifOxyC12_full_50_8]|uniref:Uncharacterized protein n=1 Tax=Candidatus Raymondbacteria bacterium RIFOXYD12_FULL_49_13 TaxID=1817890 RepID=A0A1F7F0T0_UNCRA|nr:MAG: hypothetical protein A2248_07885 [Candidatus Raymondbacteria bacterium RIFOXYA2_FULL_49_16]OGJ96585.1 MAG: hypothetical protein A2487_10595 [Candidatus Raymondbacteria bacterium RifOxyC12_full_50_8]OGK00264.1 MAG: hypothetical protein A2519_01260 [Candidatus Raymondbacteria bacterium RIFOXYD12_FULL_49_13]OGP42323.1 MAG: hypothetical protein A2324_20115 [Candidatus Raymondbacteria bacterium RIFOXYB2_FULL_49_35]